MFSPGLPFFLASKGLVTQDFYFVGNPHLVQMTCLFENLGGFPRTPHPSGPYWSFSSQSPGHSPLPKALYFVLGPLLPQWVIRCTAESFDHWSYFPSLPSSKATPEESYSCSHCVFPACAHISSRTTCGRSEAGKRRANRRMHN